MMWMAGLIGGLGLVCMISRRTILGFLVGVQILILGSTLSFIFAGVASGSRVDGHLLGFFITLGGVAQLVAGYSLAVRFFYLKKKIGMDELRSLRQ